MKLPSPKSIDIVEFGPCGTANIKEVTEPNDVPTNCEGDQMDRPSITRDATIANNKQLIIDLVIIYTVVVIHKIRSNLAYAQINDNE